MAKKLKKAILAGLTAYAASKYLKGKKMPTDYEYDASIIKKPFKHDLEASLKPPSPLSDRGKSMDHMVPKKWWKFWKKHGGSITTAKLGSMIKANQGTHVKSGTMLKARHGTEVRTMGSNPHVPKGGSVSVATKLNGTLTTKTF